MKRWLRCGSMLLAGLMLVAVAQAADGGAAPAPGSPSAQSPAALYHNYCSVCHGDRGDGQSRARGSLNPAPRDFTTAQALSELPRARMIAAVKAGVPGTAMVGWRTQLSDAQIEGVVDYVRENFMRATISADAGPGRRIYAKSCSVCHGDRGTGSMWASANLRPAPRDFSSPQARAELTRDRMVAAVAAGRPGTAMAGFASQLKPEEINAVVDYIRTAFMGEGSQIGISGTRAHGLTSAANPAPAPAAAVAIGAPAPPLRADMGLPLPASLKGDAAAGRRFYDANCATCHGVKGDGKGPRAYFINPKPRNFLTDASREQLNRPAIYAGVSAGRLGSEMPAWDKVLAPQEIANVSEYVFRAFIAPRDNGNARR
jgi:mono/diheme cytochrome c family protein